MTVRDTTGTQTPHGRAPLNCLENPSEFHRRHIGPGDEDVAEMLNTLGIESLEELSRLVVPDSIRNETPLNLPATGEADVLADLARMAERNVIRKSLIGMGYHDTITPSVLLRNVLENPGWYTAYTPYQAEISQGRMEALLNFQQMIIDLTGLQLANASLLDEATAAAEAVTMMRRAAKKNPSTTVFVANDCLPQTIAVIQTRAAPMGLDVQVGNVKCDLDPGKVFGVVLQYPGVNGDVEDYAEFTEAIHDAGALLTVAADILGLVLLRPPGEWEADIVVGSAQRFGVPMGFGGPHAAFMAAREEHKRTMPGRIIGVSEDAQGRVALRMALQTREQHIRREKATSNICTAQVLLANMAGLYAAYHGPHGLQRIAERVHRLTSILVAGLRRLDLRVCNSTWFDTFVIDMGDTDAASATLARADAAGYNLRNAGNGRVGLSFDETTSREDVAALWRILGDRNIDHLDIDALDTESDGGIPADLRRRSSILEHPVFNSHHSESGMMRYLRGLEEKDLALNRAMIPLGSCTMKLNAATEMIPITWPGFSRIHPFAPPGQTDGYRELISRLETMLCEITGFPAVSLQPNAGSQGEYAGLLAIRAFLAENGDRQRNICLIPSSAHGTNPASAVMAGMQVVVVNCDNAGNVDTDDLKSKARQHADSLAALMVTYPSTHGVYETAISEICRIVHDAGGQVYMDGANLQALVGLARPGEFGPDVMHMNLHKTFCIPHGGGGPGVGPIGVAAHLAPYLPNHPLSDTAGPDTGVGAIAAAPWGSASILPISYAYIAMMGGAGLRRATLVSILSANYIAKRLEGTFDTLYRGENELVAHECILDTRPALDAAHLTVDDIARRLMDYGFHAPTMSFPVANTLMVEPTESEPKEELDRFVDALLSIHAECESVAKGLWPADDNPLINAPHSADVVIDDAWPHAYSRTQAAYPMASLKADKYWPPVGRIDNVQGDRNLICTCPPIEDYAP